MVLRPRFPTGLPFSILMIINPSVSAEVAQPPDWIGIDGTELRKVLKIR
jgi:hypothetical protein